jgi:hypothetical protein
MCKALLPMVTDKEKTRSHLSKFAIACMVLFSSSEKLKRELQEFWSKWKKPFAGFAGLLIARSKEPEIPEDTLEEMKDVMRTVCESTSTENSKSLLGE